MDTVHQAVKVDAPLPVDCESLEEQIHEERLATANAAPDIKPGLGCAARSGGTAQQPPQPAPRPCCLQASLQLIERIDDLILGRVPLMAVATQTVFVGLANSLDTGYPFLRRITRRAET
jgi:hypothetical protein